MWEIKDDVMIIVVSDVHIGASVNHQTAFIGFLTALKSKVNNTQLKALIILGDFFDVIFESIRDYCGENPYSRLIEVLKDKTKNYNTIFDLLEQLSKKIKIFFTLGNHEIKIILNIDKNFTSRKIKFRREFEKNHFPYLELLDLDNISQYITLRVLNIGNKKRWALSFSDSKSNIFGTNQTRNPYVFQNISVPDSITNYNCLMTHGTQFESFLRTYGGGIPWWLGLISPDPIKEIGNIIYSSIKEYLRNIDEDINQWLRKQKKFFQSLLLKSLRAHRIEKPGKHLQRLLKIVSMAPFFILMKLYIKLIRLIERKRRAFKNESYYKQIEKTFLPDSEKGV